MAVGLVPQLEQRVKAAQAGHSRPSRFIGAEEPMVAFWGGGGGEMGVEAARAAACNWAAALLCVLIFFLHLFSRRSPGTPLKSSMKSHHSNE